MNVRNVPRRNRHQAIELLAGDVPGKAGGLQSLFDAGGRFRRLVWVCEGRTPQAVGMLLASAGRVGFVYIFSATSAASSDPALVEVLTHLTDQAKDMGLEVIQTFIAPTSPEPVALSEAKFELFTELLELAGDIPDAAPVDDKRTHMWTFECVHDERRLGELIQETYVGSEDCPILQGSRDMSFVIESHRSTGHYMPTGWLWAHNGSEEFAGCILLNRGYALGEAQVAYMGVVPQYRRKGLGTALLQHGAKAARAAGCRRWRVFVDADNRLARRLYERFGFENMGQNRIWGRVLTHL